MGIANFETESKFEMLMLAVEQKEYENWLDSIESEEYRMAMEGEAMRLLNPNTVILSERELSDLLMSTEAARINKTTENLTYQQTDLICEPKE